MSLRAQATSKAGAQNGSPRSSMPLMSATVVRDSLGRDVLRAFWCGIGFFGFCSLFVWLKFR
jgi:hypothetical protein